MRISHLKSLLQLSRLKKLRADFKTPYKALLAASGLIRRPLRLTTVEKIEITVDRRDLPIWHEYFSSQHCQVRLRGNLFHIQPNHPEHPAYYIKGATGNFTFAPRRWNLNAYKSPLVCELDACEYSVYSQHGEDGVLQRLFEIIPIEHRFIIEFGAHDGIKMSNSRYWIEEHGWSALLIESDPRFYKSLSNLYRNNPSVTTLKSMVTPENIDDLFLKAGVPKTFEVLSIDIDSIDYYVWQGLSTFRPKVVIMECNPSFPPDQDFVVSREKALDGSSFEGASIAALYRLGLEKGYQLIYSELRGSNLFFVDQGLANLLNIRTLTVEELYQPPQFGRLAGTKTSNGRGIV